MTHKSRTLLVMAALMTGSSLGACKQTPTEAHNEGVEAQREANEKIGEARERAETKVHEARRDEVEAAAEARKNAAEAQANANEKIRDANRSTIAHDNTRSWAQAKLDDVDNMIDAANAKAQAAPPKAKARFTTGLEEVKQQRDTLRTEIASLEASNGSRLEKAKEQFDDRVDRIKANIRNLEKSL